MVSRQREAAEDHAGRGGGYGDEPTRLGAAAYVAAAAHAPGEARRGSSRLGAEPQRAQPLDQRVLRLVRPLRAVLSRGAHDPALPGSASSSASRARPRAAEAFTVPTAHSMTAAHSASGRSRQ
ncbi:hypothetical protein EV189_3414 [Motilibacter rhizosphaerae]|uniref:Uncharacterized protein n=1 Tax=Motilibacter rhizosphaerae TaxID=598652 RepID=A0A4Q7NAQ1_9ACTN|nr:hypothetical protein EV189_3414 [Motilibacter rhizosphaerae]